MKTLSNKYLKLYLLVALVGLATEYVQGQDYIPAKIIASDGTELTPGNNWTSVDGNNRLEWQEDGSVIVNGGPVTFTSGIASPPSSIDPLDQIDASDMILVDETAYNIKEDDSGIDYGVDIEVLEGSGDGYYVPNVKVEVYRRGQDTGNMNFGFDFTDNDYLVYGTQLVDVNSYNNWDAYGFLAHGLNFNKTQIKSNDYTKLWNRPNDTSRWWTLFDAALVIVLVLIAAELVGASTVIANIASQLASSGVSVAGLGSMAPKLLGILALSVSGIVMSEVKIKHYAYPTGDEKGISPQISYTTNQEFPVPPKISDATVGSKSYNHEVDEMNKHAKPCSFDNSKSCIRKPFRAVVVKVTATDTHLKSVSIPGAIFKKHTPYQLFNDYYYYFDRTGTISVSGSGLNYLKGSDKFTAVSGLPNNVGESSSDQSVTLEFNGFTGFPYFYLIAKDEPFEVNNFHYKDLGKYGEFDGSVYNLYRYRAKNREVGNPFVSVDIGPTGPFLAGDNLILEQSYNKVEVFVNGVYEYNSDAAPPDHLLSLPDLKLGDEITFRVTLSDGVQIEDVEINGLPGVWIARAAREAKYYCTPSVRPGEYAPFLGWDSEVHGTKIRKYPEGFEVKIPDWQEVDGVYTWSWTLQRRMDASVAPHDFNSNLSQWSKTKDVSASALPDAPNMLSQKQRNSQMEGINMQLLHAWWRPSDWSGSTEPNYSGSYVNDKYLLGLDGDEFLYVNGQYYNTIDKDGNPIPDHVPALIVRDTRDVWKYVPEQEGSSAINDMVTAYQQNRTAQDGGDASAVDPYAGYEIEDKTMYRTTATSAGWPQDKIYDPYEKDGVVPENNAAPGMISVRWGDGADDKIDLKVDVTSPLATDRGFYGSISGTQWPAVFQKKVPYTLSGLEGLTTEELGKFILQYEYEDALGKLTIVKRRLADNALALGSASSTGRWTERFDIQGHGYHTITAYYRRTAESEPVMIAGKELMEIQLRFLASPDASTIVNFDPDADMQDVVALKENGNGGEGAFWYLRDFNYSWPDQIPLYGYEDGNFQKEYTFTIGDKVTFLANDADPITFWQQSTEWYQSQRIQSRKIPNDSLDVYLTWSLSPVAFRGFQGKESIVVSKNEDLIVRGSGRTFTHTFDKQGSYELFVSYSTDPNAPPSTHIAAMVHVVELDYDKNKPNDLKTKDKGEIALYDISPEQQEWLGLTDEEVNTYKFATVEKLLSEWSYVDAPRQSQPADASDGQQADMAYRFAKKNNYQDEYYWYNQQKEFINNHTKVADFITSYELDKSRESWFPINWIRHHDDRNHPIPLDIDPGDVKTITFANPFDLSWNSILDSNLPSEAPEAWQWRMPWTAWTPYQGYRTRTNIKAIYNLDKFWDETDGAFAGNGNVQYGDDYTSYHAAVRSAFNFTDEQKAKYDFYLDLRKGRRFLVNVKENSFLIATNKNLEVSTTEYVENFMVANYRVNPGLGEGVFLLGADLSELSAQEVCIGGNTPVLAPDQTNLKEAYDILENTQANTVRLHLWHTPRFSDPTITANNDGSNKWKYKDHLIQNGDEYPFNTLEDTSEQIKRAKSKNFKVLLDIMYSDFWANPSQQMIPRSWMSTYDEIILGTKTWDDLAQLMHDYTQAVLLQLSYDKALPDYVQVGNETMSNIVIRDSIAGYLRSDKQTIKSGNPANKSYSYLDEVKRVLNWDHLTVEQRGGKTDPDRNSLLTINWDRQSILINAALEAIHEFNQENGTDIYVMLHWNNLESAMKYYTNVAFESAEHGRWGTKVIDKELVDAIGLSYYQVYSDFSMQQVKYFVENIGRSTSLDVVIVETAYPYTVQNGDNTPNQVDGAIASTPRDQNLLDCYCEGKAAADPDDNGINRCVQCLVGSSENNCYQWNDEHEEWELKTDQWVMSDAYRGYVDRSTRVWVEGVVTTSYCASHPNSEFCWKTYSNLGKGYWWSYEGDAINPNIGESPYGNPYAYEWSCDNGVPIGHEHSGGTEDISESGQQTWITDLISNVKQASYVTGAGKVIHPGKGVILYAPFNVGCECQFMNARGASWDNAAILSTTSTGHDYVGNLPKNDQGEVIGGLKAIGYNYEGFTRQIPVQNLIVDGVNYVIDFLRPSAEYGDYMRVSSVNASEGLYFLPLRNRAWNKGKGRLRISTGPNESVEELYFMAASSTKEVLSTLGIVSEAIEVNGNPVLATATDWEGGTTKNTKFKLYRVTLSQPLSSGTSLLTPYSGLDGPFLITASKPIVRKPSVTSANEKILKRKSYPDDYLICAHRGYWEHLPENHTLSLAEAKRLKADFSEVDVYMTYDSVLVLTHDGFGMRETDYGTEGIDQVFYQNFIDYVTTTGRDNLAANASVFVGATNPYQTIANTKAFQSTDQTIWSNTPDSNPDGLPIGLENAKLRTKDGKLADDGAGGDVTINSLEDALIWAKANDVFLAIDHGLTNALAYEVYDLALTHGMTDNLLFKSGTSVSPWRLEKDYGAAFMQQLIYSPYYNTENNQNPEYPYPWVNYLAIQEKIREGWTVPAYEVQFKNNTADATVNKAFNQMLDITARERDKSWLGVTPLIPTGCNNYYLAWLKDQCETYGFGCANYDWRMNMDYEIGMGVDYFITDDLKLTQEYLDIIKTALNNGN